MKMPPVSDVIVRRRSSIANALAAIVGRDWVLEDEAERRPYESDGLAVYRTLPLLVVLPRTTDEVRNVLAYCHKQGIKVVPRGSGTSLSGGALPLEDGILLGTSRMNQILEVDPENRVARVQPGLQNAKLTEAVQHLGLCFMPDPSSQAISSVGGNVAENSGGVHCLKYGVTSNHVLGIEAVLINGELVRFGGNFIGASDAELDLTGLLVGSEGMLAVITEITVRLTPQPPVARVLSIGFSSVEAAGECVGAILAEGIIPAGLEFMDRKVIEAVSSMTSESHDKQVDALLLCELDGMSVEVDMLVKRVETIAARFNACEVRISHSDAERERLWHSRKAAFGAMGKIARDVYVTDGTIPRGKLAEVLRRIDSLSKEFGLQYANCFHAGDGNLHPMVLFDSAQPDQMEKAEAFGAAILRTCVDLGGVLTGEHGVGVEKRDLMTYQFREVDLAQQQAIKCVFDAHELLNPGKVFPTPCRCVEMGRLHMNSGKMRFSDIPRF